MNLVKYIRIYAGKNAYLRENIANAVARHVGGSANALIALTHVRWVAGIMTRVRGIARMVSMWREGAMLSFRGSVDLSRKGVSPLKGCAYRGIPML